MKMRLSNYLAALLVSITLAVPALAQEDSPRLDLEHLEKQASERVTITLDKQMLEFATRFLPRKDPETPKVQALVKNLESIYVRNFTFKREKPYSPSDVEKIRKQLGSEWSRLVEVRGRENVDFYLKHEGEHVKGFTVIVADPTELTVVSIRGAMDPEQLRELEGFGGIPRGLWKSGSIPKSPPTKAKSKH